jgi:hypothetical protein
VATGEEEEEAEAVEEEADILVGKFGRKGMKRRKVVEGTFRLFATRAFNF